MFKRKLERRLIVKRKREDKMEDQKYIMLKCDCGEQYSVKRNKKDSKDVSYYTCNWCPACMKKSKDPYNEVGVYK